MKLRVAASLVFAVVVLAVPAEAETPLPTAIHTQWAIQTLAMSGRTVAYDVSGRFRRRPPKGCANKIFAYDLTTRTTRRISWAKTCYADGTPTGDGVRELAVAGTRFAWIVNQGETPRATTTSAPRRSRVRESGGSRWRPASATSAALRESGSEPWSAPATCSPSTVGRPPPARSAGAIRELDVIGPAGLRRILSGPEAVFAQGVDSGRIAVLRNDGSVGIYAASGKLLLEVQPSSAKEVALNGRDLVVLTKTRTLEIYDSESDARGRIWTVSRQATTLDVYGGLAVYADQPENVIGRLQVHALGLATGKDAVVGTGPSDRRPARDVQLEARGLVYAKDAHTLVFVPFSRVRAAVS